MGISCMEHGNQDNFVDSDGVERMRRILGHRLLNISAGIKTATGYLASQLDERLSPLEREYFPLLQKQCDEVTYIVNRINLLFKKMEKPEPVPVQQALNDALYSIREAFPNVTLNCTLPECQDASLVICPQSVSTALYEAVDNARLASLEPISISAVIASGQCVLRVRDCGTPLDEAAAQQVFDMFYTTRSQAMGLGLSIARRLVQEQGGSVSFGAESDGNYVEFIVPLQKRLSV